MTEPPDDEPAAKELAAPLEVPPRLELLELPPLEELPVVPLLEPLPEVCWQKPSTQIVPPLHEIPAQLGLAH